MFYLVYQTVCTVNGKTYVGKHKASRLYDGYLGSGKLISRAIRKYGKENFVSIILGQYDAEWKMNLAERILVVPDAETSYNLCPGGHGGFGYINATGRNLYGQTKADTDRVRPLALASLSRLRADPDWAASISAAASKALSNYYKAGGTNGFAGKTHGASARLAIGKSSSAAQKGAGNSQFGKPRSLEVRRRIAATVKRTLATKRQAKQRNTEPSSSWTRRPASHAENTGS